MKAGWPMISWTPVTSTLPGVHDIDGPRAVRHRPEVERMASAYLRAAVIEVGGKGTERWAVVSAAVG